MLLDVLEVGDGVDFGDLAPVIMHLRVVMRFWREGCWRWREIEGDRAQREDWRDGRDGVESRVARGRRLEPSAFLFRVGSAAIIFGFTKQPFCLRAAIAV